MFNSRNKIISNKRSHRFDGLVKKMIAENFSARIIRKLLGLSPSIDALKDFTPKGPEGYDSDADMRRLLRRASKVDGELKKYPNFILSLCGIDTDLLDELIVSLHKQKNEGISLPKEKRAEPKKLNLENLENKKVLEQSLQHKKGFIEEQSKLKPLTSDTASIYRKYKEACNNYNEYVRKHTRKVDNEARRYDRKPAESFCEIGFSNEFCFFPYAYKPVFTPNRKLHSRIKMKMESEWWSKEILKGKLDEQVSLEFESYPKYVRSFK